jgi:hypothetical protein
LRQLIKRKKVENDIERQLLIGLITSDVVCRDVIPALQNVRILKSEYIATVIGWIREYYQTYKEAPHQQIEQIYNEKKAQVNEDQQDLISILLSSLSDTYEEEEESNPNYLIDIALEYIEERNLLYLSEVIKQKVEKKDLKGARKELSNYKKVARSTSQWVNPLSIEEVNRAMTAEEDALFKYPEKLGQMIGDFYRGDLVAFLAPVKRGKTWMLMETAIRASTKKLKVAFISIQVLPLFTGARKATKSPL